ncbi:unnamed protein product [Symbiodinium necroappetens]|uniref:Uncharacterized protein n=1 Tax=Symbiodinium necroappetens TaxID=1628268 RepID=A0A812J2A7_9DINO|nr:unnamed protein product [Symbiodinium necroappetens]
MAEKKDPRTLSCIWAKHGAKWCSRWPWLTAVEDEAGKVQWLGCSTCSQCPGKQSDQNPFAGCRVPASSAQTSVFENHAKSRAHKERSESLGADSGVPVVAPSVREFADVLDAVFKGDSELDSCGPWKFRCMTWCLAEAHRNVLREKLAKSESISLVQDVRKNQLLVMFTSVDAGLEVTSGVLGQVDLAERSSFQAKGLFRGTVLVLGRFVARNLGKPVRDGNPTGTLDESLLQTIKAKVELYATDAAADEQRAGRLLQRFFSSLQVVQYDKAHAAQRILSRTWPTDPHIHRLVQELVTGENALTQKIRHSGIFRKRWEEAVAAMTPQAKRKIKNLACAKHRWLSAALPFRRAVLYLRPLIRVAQSIVAERGRGTPEGETAHRWLSNLSSETALQLAMVADATDETLAVSRFFDKDTYNKAELTAEISKFLCKCTWLFERRGVLGTGFTAYILELLRRSPCNFNLGGKVCSIQSPSQHDIESCLQRMTNWLQLVRLTIQAEFPHFEALQLFRLFDLQSTPMPSDMERMSHLLKLNHAQFKREFEDLRPSAEWHWRHGHPDCQLAWHAAAKKTPPGESLNAALIRYLSWQANTSPLERGFAKSVQSCSKNRADVSETRVDDQMQLLSLCRTTGRGRARALPKHENLIESARVLWTSHFGLPRNRQRVPEHLRGRKRSASSDSTETSFLKRRRSEVEQGAAGVDSKDAFAAAERQVGVHGWQQSHEDERRFLQLKQKGRFCMAVRDGALPWDKLSQRLKDFYLAYLANDDRLSAQAWKKNSFRFQRPAFPNLTGGSIWWTEDAQRHGTEIQMRRVSRKLGLEIVESPLQATVHVWLQLTQPASAADMWMVALHGKLVLDLTCFLSEGRKGGFLVYEAAIAVQRCIHVTPRFARDHARIAHDILYYCKPRFRGLSRWVAENALPEFRKQMQKALAAKKPTRVLVFGTDVDKQSDLGQVKLFVTAADLQVLLHVDDKRSWYGMGPQ